MGPYLNVFAPEEFVAMVPPIKQFCSVGSGGYNNPLELSLFMFEASQEISHFPQVYLKSTGYYQYMEKKISKILKINIHLKLLPFSKSQLSTNKD